MTISRAEIVRIAVSYLGTPFHHMGRQPGVGLDCAGVLVCVAREAHLVSQTFDVPAYTPTPDGRSMREWCDKYMRRVQQSEMKAGDAILLITDKDPQHLGLLGVYRYGGFSIIHASNASNPPRVIETRLMFSRAQRFVAAYALPGVE